MQAVEAQHEDAVENRGDMEVLICLMPCLYVTFSLIIPYCPKVMDALFAKARHYSSIGDVDNAYAAYDFILNKDKVSIGRKIDATMEKSRLAFFSSDTTRQKNLLEEAKKLIDLGGDWDRRNRLKVR